MPQDFNKGAGGKYIYACLFRSAPLRAEACGLWDLAIAITTVGATDTCKTLTDTYGENHLYVSAEWGGVGANGNWNLGASGRVRRPRQGALPRQLHLAARRLSKS